MKERRVVSVVLLQDNQALMQLRDDNPHIRYPNYWCPPSGGVEPNEELLTAAKRELLEETGYQLEDAQFGDKIVYSDESGIPVEHTYLVGVYDKIQPIQCFEGQKMQFKTAQEIQLLLMIPEAKRAVLGILSRLQ